MYQIVKIRDRKIIGGRSTFYQTESLDTARAQAYRLNKQEGKEITKRKPWHVIFVPE